MTNEYSADLAPILEAIVDRAARLCESQDARIFVVEGNSLRYVAGFGEVPFPVDPIRPLTRRLITGRAVIDRAVVHIEDMVAAAQEFPDVQKYQQYTGNRTALSVPLVRGDKALGVILMRRSEVRPFDAKHIELVKAFADQAAAAIENLQLSTELKARNAELTEALDQQTATADILRVISSSPTDIQPVLDAVAESAARLCNADDVIIRRIDGDTTWIAAHIGSIPVQTDGGVTSVSLRTMMGTVARERRTLHIPDVTDPHEREKYPDARFAGVGMWGIRTNLIVPLLREGVVIGAIGMRRREVRPFSDKQIKLLETFAAQAVIAIENVRLFNETKEALEQQTATAEVLKVMSGSPTDTLPVFDAIVKSCARLFGSKSSTLRLVVGNQAELVASTLPRTERDFPIPIDDESMPASRAIVRREVVHVPDALETEWGNPRWKERTRQRGYRAAIVAPMLRDNRVVGTINVTRANPGPFSEKQIALLKTFADQAVIAIENVRLFNETKEALEQQTATAEILKVISSSPTDTQPVFDAIVTSGLRLFGGMIVSLRIVKGDHSELAASTDSTTANAISLSEVDSPTTRAIRRREVVQVPDMLVEEWVPERSKQRAKLRGFRAIVSAPLLRENTAIGVINVLRASPGPFTDKEVALLKTFADQAVIAIENVRLFNETKEALEQQTVISEILRVISSSPTDTQPVFDAIVKSGVHLFEGMNVSLRLIRGDHTETVASTIPLSDADRHPIPLRDQGSPSALAIQRREVVQVPDVGADDQISKLTKQRAERRGFRAVLSTPMLKDGVAVGAINVLRTAAGPFTDKQIALLKTFAAQAVIAIENVRLFNETKEALEQQTATADVLRVISSSPTDVQPVLNTVAERSGLLCRAEGSRVWLARNGQMHAMASYGTVYGSDSLREVLPLRTTTVVGRAFLERRCVHVEDIVPLIETEYPDLRELQARLGFRTVLAVPMLREGEPIGVIALIRNQRPFAPAEISLIETFAAQAVIAIENVRLFNETKEALEQQTATAEILKVISSSPTDVQPVFEAIVKSGVHLFDGLNVVLRLVKGDHIEQVASTLPRNFDDDLPFELSDGIPSSRAILRREVIEVPDVFAEKALHERVKRRAEQLGYRALLAAPMLRESKAIGAITVTRATTGLFTRKQIALLKTFADQAVIAIENVRLFKELQTRNAEVTEALEQQTATAEILKVISSSPTDTRPVFDAIVKSGVRLFNGLDVVLRLIKGDQAEAVASTLPQPSVRIPLSDEGSPTAQAIRRCEVVQLADALAESGVSEEVKRRAIQLGMRAVISAPMMRENTAIGVINVFRAAPGPFTEKEVALLRTFADQAVIAIENVRLFNETKEALEQQTVISEILRVISSSPTDTQPVFDAIVKSGLHFFGGMNVSLRLIKGDYIQTVASTLPVENTGGVFPVALGDESLPASRSVMRREVVQIPDILAPENWVSPRARQRAKDRSWRSMMAAPLLRENDALGVVSVSRATPGLFSDKQVALLQTFAAQAVIAIENVRLFKELQARNAEVTEALEQQTATAEILRVISSSPTDTQPVFDAIVKSGVQLFGGLNMTLRLVKGDRNETVASSLAGWDEKDRFSTPLDDERFVSPRAMLRRDIVHVPDIREEEWLHESMKVRFEKLGSRAVLCAPMMRENKAIGAITVIRATPGLFNDKQVALLRTFADQAVIAIENVRLFKELQARNAEITESLDQQTATSEILRVISSSPTDTQPVFQAILSNATRLCDASVSALFLLDGEVLVNVAHQNASPEFIEYLAQSRPRPSRETTSRRAALERKTIHVSDLLNAPEYSPPEFHQRENVRTVLSVPLLREGALVGVVTMWRREVRPFTDNQIALVQTFGDQAVIAIENVRLFKEIQEKGRQLEVANKHKSEFLANMSHELRTPLNAVIGFSEALIEKMFGELNAKQEDYLRDIHSSGRHLLSLINDILDLSKIEAGRMELELSDFSVPMALKNAIALVRGRAQTHGIALKLRVDPKLGEIRADERKFKQIVVNLLSNAVKFTPDGGHVDVYARRNGNAIKVSVKDDGIGIAAKDQEALFEAFRQVGSDYTTKREGTGLGLALTRRFVELHGGKILLESKPGRGSTFTFTLPLSGNPGP